MHSFPFPFLSSNPRVDRRESSIENQNAQAYSPCGCWVFAKSFAKFGDSSSARGISTLPGERLNRSSPSGKRRPRGPLESRYRAQRGPDYHFSGQIVAFVPRIRENPCRGAMSGSHASGEIPPSRIVPRRGSAVLHRPASLEASSGQLL